LLKIGNRLKKGYSFVIKNEKRNENSKCLFKPNKP
jgi:hypothetical protein